MSEGKIKPLVLMVCAHEPTMDPRIRWEAEGAARDFEVVVLGFNRRDGSLPDVERVDGYLIKRLPNFECDILSYFWRLKDALSRTTRAVLLALVVLFYPVLILAELAFRIVRGIVRLPKQIVRAVFPNLATLRLVMAVVRSRLHAGSSPAPPDRLAYVLAVLRSQFAPATWSFWKYVREMPRKPDVIHCNDLDTLLVGVLAKKHFGCRVVYDAHEYLPFSDPHGQWLDQTAFHYLERFLIRRVDAAVTVNHALAVVMQRAYGLARIDAVPNAEPWVAGPRRAIKSRMTELAAGRIKFLFQGRYSPGRGLEELVEGWRGVDSARSALFLRGPGNVWEENLRVLAARLGLLDRDVYFIDAVAEADLVDAAAEADVGIIPYKGDVAGYKYACPNKLSQYLHAGMMVISNDLPYVREVLEQSRAGLVYSLYGGDRVADVVNRIAADPELLRRCRANALRYAESEFNWQNASKPLYRHYAGTVA